jgi:hypothetical protein
MEVLSEVLNTYCCMEVLSEVMHSQMSPVVLDYPTIAVAVKYPFKNQLNIFVFRDRSMKNYANAI